MFRLSLVVLAKKLKRIWVESKKIKAKWRANKARQALATTDTGNVDVPSALEAEVTSTGGSYPAPNKRKSGSADKRTPVSQPTASSHNSPRPAIDVVGDRFSHTEKSNSLHESKKLHPVIETSRSTSRHQPNMKLRMGALLEKIKRDHAEPVGR
jgi:hypothetical protein